MDKSKRKKIRHKNWYWGNFIHDGDVMDNSRITVKTPDSVS